MLPSATFTKADGQTGVVRPSSSGVLAVIAAAASGTKNQAASFARQADVLATSGLGPLVECCAYYMQNAGKPVVAISPTTTTAAAYGTLGRVFSGTSVPTTTGTPLDEYNVIVTFTAGGTIGVAGILYTYSLDGGANTSAVQALGTANSVTLNVPGLGVSSGVAFNFAAGTIVAGDTMNVTTTRAQMNNSDLVTALEALRITKLPWDGVLIDGDVTAAMISTVDSWLAGLEANGVFKMAWMNTRHKTRPAPSAESEATFATAMASLVGSTSTIRVDVGTDAGDIPSPVTGLTQARPTALFVATRAQSFPVGVDPAFVANGALPGVSITDTNGNPKWHDEALYPGLDALRLTTLRSFSTKNGVYITNANILSPPGSDYVYDQHARCMNIACTIAYDGLTTELSKGVRKQPPDPVTGKIYILEQDAAAIESQINPTLSSTLDKQVTAVAVQLSRTDDLSSNAGATVSAEVQMESLAYIKDFAVTAKFVRTLTVPTS